jgi:quinol monooxygenase YgiN
MTTILRAFASRCRWLRVEIDRRRVDRPAPADASIRRNFVEMALIDDRDAGKYDERIVSVMKMRIDPKQAAGLLTATLNAFRSESNTLIGFLTAQVLLSVDNETIVIMSEWSDRHAWGKSRYDPIVESLIENCYDNASTIEFEVYTRRGTVSRAPTNTEKKAETMPIGVPMT